MTGRVVSTKMQKTAVVLIESTKRHPLYGKSYLSTKKYMVDDPVGVALGDIVELKKIRPISKKKHWQITKVVGKDVVALGEKAMKEVAAEAIAEVMPEEELLDISQQPPEEKEVKEKTSKKKEPKKLKTKY